MRFTPHEYQSFTIKQLIERKRVFAVLEMGLG